MKNNIGKKRRRKERWIIFSFLAPNIVGFLIFTLIPVFATGVISLTEWNLIGEMEFVGLENYFKVFETKRFYQVMGNTLFYTIATVPIGLFLALCLSVLMNRKIRGITVYRTIYYLPVVSSGVAIAMLWKYLYADNVGLLAMVWKFFGAEAPRWLTSTKWSMTAISIMSVWKGLGGTIVLLLAGLQSISPSYYEAAKIDGANGWQQFTNVTIPLLTPTLFFQLIMSIINSFQVFDATAILTEGGPGFSSTSIVYYIYTSAFKDLKFGYACALAMVLFFIILVITLVQWLGQKKWVNYDA